MKKSIKLLFLAVIISIVAIIIAKNSAKADNVVPSELTVGSTIIVKYEVIDNCMQNIQFESNGGVQSERVNSSGQTWDDSRDTFDGAFYRKYTFSGTGSKVLNATAQSRKNGYLCSIQYETMNINIVESGTRSDVGVVTASKQQTEYSIMESNNAINELVVNINDSSKTLSTNLSGSSLVWSSGNTSILTVSQNGSITPVSVGKTVVRVTKSENEWIEVPVEITTKSHADVAVNGVVQLCFDLPANYSEIGFAHPYYITLPQGGSATKLQEGGRKENGKWILEFRLDTAGTYTFYDFELQYKVFNDDNTYTIKYNDVVDVTVGSDGESTKAYNINQKAYEDGPATNPSVQQVNVTTNGVINLCFNIPSNVTHVGFTHPFTFMTPDGGTVTEVHSNGILESNKWTIDYRLDTAGTYSFSDFELEYKVDGDPSTHVVKYYDVVDVIVGENGEASATYTFSKTEPDQFVTIPEGHWNVTNNSADVEYGKSVTLTYTFPQGLKKYQIKAIASDSSSEHGIISIGNEVGTVSTQTYTYDNSTATTQLVVKVYGVGIGTRTINFAQLGNITNANGQENCITSIPSVTINVTPAETNLTGAWDKTSDTIDTGSSSRFAYTFSPKVKKYEIKVTQTSSDGGKVSFSRTNADKTEETYNYNGSEKEKFVIDPLTGIDAGTVTLHFEVLGDGITVEDGTVKTLSIPDVTITVNGSGSTPSTDLTGAWDKTSDTIDQGSTSRFTYTFTPQVKKYSIKVTQTSSNGGKVSFSRTNSDKTTETYDYDSDAKSTFSIDGITGIDAGTVTLHFEVLGNGITINDDTVKTLSIPDVTITVNGSGETPSTLFSGVWDKTSETIDVASTARFMYTFSRDVKKYDIKVTQTSSNGGKVSFSRTNADETTKTYNYDGNDTATLVIDPVTGIDAGTVTLHFEVLGNGITLRDNSVKTLNIPDVTIIVNGNGETPSTTLTGAWDKTTDTIDKASTSRFTYTFTPQVKKYSIKVTQTSSNGGKVSFSRTDADETTKTYDYDSSAKSTFTIDPITGIDAGTVTLHFEVLGNGITLNDNSVKTISIPDVTITVNGSGETPSTSLTGTWDKTSDTIDKACTSRFTYTFTPQVKKYSIKVTQTSSNGGKVSFSRTNADKTTETYNYDSSAKSTFTIDPITGIDAGTVTLHFEVLGNGITLSNGTVKTLTIPDVTVTVRGSNNGNTDADDKAPTIVPSGPIVMTVGAQKTLSASKAVKWSSSDLSKVSIDETTGVIKAKAVTTTPVTITATAIDNNKTATIRVSVVAESNPGEETKKDPVISSQGNTTVNVGETIKLTSDKDVTWESGNTSIATVDSNGNVKAVGSGTVLIYAKASDGSFSYITLTVKATNTNNNSGNSENGGSSSSSEQSSDGAVSKSGSTANSTIPQTGEASKALIAAIGIVVALIAVAIFKKKSK